MDIRNVSMFRSTEQKAPTYSHLKTSHNAGKKTKKRNEDENNGKEQEMTLSERLSNQRENIKKRISELNERLATIDPTDQKQYKAYKTKIEIYEQRLQQIEQEWAAAVADEQQRAFEEMRRKLEKTGEKAKKNEDYESEEEKKRKLEEEQSKFFVKSDLAMKNASEGRKTLVNLERTEGRQKAEMANDAALRMDQAQRTAAGKSAMGNGISLIPWVSDTSPIKEQARLEMGKFMIDEYKKSRTLKEMQKASQNAQEDLEETIVEIKDITEEYTEKVEEITSAPEKEDKDKKEDEAAVNPEEEKEEVENQVREKEKETESEK